MSELEWNYICILVDLFNREIIGYSASPHKTAKLVKQAFMIVHGCLKNNIFHTDYGNEFKNQLSGDTLDALKLLLADYVNWFNNHRIHSSPGYLTPVEYRMNNLKKVIWFTVDNPEPF